MRTRFKRHTAGVRLSEGARGDHTLSGGQPPLTLTPAAVLVALIAREDGLRVLLTQRASNLSNHPDQISLPGGRIDPGDEDAIAAALREAEEEIGLPASHVELVGRLDTYITATGFEITPAVALVRAPFAERLDPFEVAELFEVPLSYIIDPAHHERHTREVRGRTRSYYVLPYENRYIWGATAAILVNLAEVLSG